MGVDAGGGHLVEEHALVALERGLPVAEDLRFVVKAVVGEENFIDMYPNRSNNYCCGGGGGTVSIDEIRRFRTTVGGRTKADQIRATGAERVICTHGYSEIFARYLREEGYDARTEATQYEGEAADDTPESEERAS